MVLSHPAHQRVTHTVGWLAQHHGDLIDPIRIGRRTMIETRLIHVDGIPGSGKSTTAQWIALELRKRTMAADWFMDEHRGNPVTAWGAPDTDLFISRTLDNWQHFSRAAQSSNTVFVLEGSLFQHILLRLLLADIERPRIHACIHAVGDYIRPLNPAFIHLYQADVALSLRTISAERGAEWAQYMLDGYNQSLYATARHISGFDALVAFYQEYTELLHLLHQELGFKTLMIENTGRDWPVYQAQILQFLSLATIMEEPPGSDYLARFEGRYRDLSGSHPRDPECTIELKSNQLVIYNFRYAQSRLIPKAPGEFYLETLGYEVSFEVDGQGQASKMKIGGKEPGVGIGSATLLGREYHRIADK
jgi:hypothetical protein